MTKQQQKAIVSLNLGVGLADAAHSLFLDFDSFSKVMGANLKPDEKYKLKLLRHSVEMLRTRLKEFTDVAYKCEDVDGFCDDADYILETNKLIADRVGSNEQKQLMVHSMIYNIKSELDLF